MSDITQAVLPSKQIFSEVVYNDLNSSRAPYARKTIVHDVTNVHTKGIGFTERAITSVIDPYNNTGVPDKRTNWSINDILHIKHYFVLESENLLPDGFAADIATYRKTETSPFNLVSVTPIKITQQNVLFSRGNVTAPLLVYDNIIKIVGTTSGFAVHMLPNGIFDNIPDSFFCNYTVSMTQGNIIKNLYQIVEASYIGTIVDNELIYNP